MCDGKIKDVIQIQFFKPELFDSNEIEDFGNLVIMPGLVDLNVALNESASFVTKQALTGGVTTLATTDKVSGELYTNVAQITLNSMPSASSLASKILLHPEPEDLQSLIQSEKPVFINPEVKILTSIPLAVVQEELVETQQDYDDMSNLTLKASKFTLESEDESSEESQSDTSESESEPEIVISDFSDSPVKKRVSMPLISKNEIQEIKILNSPRHFSVQVNTQKKIPLQDLPFIAKGIQVQHAYAQHIRNCPEESEIEAVKLVLKHQPKGPIHFSNVSSAEALKLIQQFKKDSNCQITCETSTPYLYFSQNDIKPGDTRYKISPPIRDYSNYKQLWQLLKNKEIDCVSSFHQPVNPPQKFIGDFFKAKNGILSVGFTLQALWTRLRSQVSREEEFYFICLLSTVLCEKPAKILGLNGKGSICVGNDADLVVWDPFSKYVASKSFDRFPEMNPMIGEEFYGIIHRTYLDGQVVFSGSRIDAFGKVLGN